jgi:hypothetical protein
MQNVATKRRIELALWTGMLAPPIAWLIQFQILYSNVLPSCVSNTKVGLFSTTAICFLIALASGALAWRELRRNPAPDELVKSRRFMSYVGLMTSGLFALVIIAQTIAVIVVDPCRI